MGREEKRYNLVEIAVSCYATGQVLLKFFASFDLTEAKNFQFLMGPHKEIMLHT